MAFSHMMPPEETIAPPGPAPQYRYFTALPEILYLKAEDLTAFLPEEAWVGSATDKQRKIAVPTAGILGTNYPRINFLQLCDLLPECVQPIAGNPEWVALPADRVALACKAETRRELLSEISTESPAASISPSEAPIPAWKRLPKPVLAPAPETTVRSEVGNETSKLSAPLAMLQVSAGSEPLLGEVFGTTATLSARQLVDLCNAQPGVKACMLSLGAESVKSGDLIPGLDAPGVKSEVFAAVRKIGATSGMKVKKILTFYTDSGPVSFLRHRELILAVLHTENGPVAETHSKLKLILQAIDRAVPPAEAAIRTPPRQIRCDHA